MTRLGLAFALLLGGCVHKDTSRFDEGDRGQLDPGEWNVKITRKGVTTSVAEVYAWCADDAKVHEVVCVSSAESYCEVDMDLITADCKWEPVVRKSLSNTPKTCDQVCPGKPCFSPTAFLRNCQPPP